MSEPMSQAEFARHRGVSKKTVTVWKRDGRLVWRDGKIDVEASDAVLDGRELPGNVAGNGGNPGQGNGEAPAGGVTLPASAGDAGVDLQHLMDQSGLMTKEQAELVKQNYLALLRRLEYDREAERVVEVDRIVQEVAAEYAKVRAKLLDLPTELAPRLAQVDDANEAREILAEGITKTLEELTHDGGDAG